MPDTALSLADLERNDPKAKIRGRECRFLCPLPACSDHQKPKEHRSLTANMDTGAWHCWRCKAAGKLKDKWEDRPPVPRKQKARAAAIRAIKGKPARVDTSPTDDEKRPAESLQEQYAAAFKGSPAARYLAHRGIPQDLAAAHGCGYAPSMYGAARVTFPVRDRAGELVAIQGRTCTERKDMKDMGPKRFGVFNPDALAGPVRIIVEAPIDALSLAVCGYPAAALIGTEYPAWLPGALVRGTVYLATDADDAGDRAAAKLDDAIRLAECVRLRPPHPHKDWNDARCKMGRDALAAWLSDRLAPTDRVPAAVQDVTTRGAVAAMFAHLPGTSPEPPPPSAPVLVQSRVLGEAIRLVETLDGPPTIPAAGEPVTYTRAEVESMKGLDPDAVRAVHRAKRFFGGSYTGPTPAPPASREAVNIPDPPDPRQMSLLAE